MCVCIRFAACCTCRAIALCCKRTSHAVPATVLRMSMHRWVFQHEATCLSPADQHSYATAKPRIMQCCCQVSPTSKMRGPIMQDWALQLSERNWRNAVLVHNTNLFLHDWLKRAALKEGFCAFCCRSVHSHTVLCLCTTMWSVSFDCKVKD